MVKNESANAGDIRGMGSIPGLGRCPGGGHGRRIPWTEKPGRLRLVCRVTKKTTEAT